MLVCIRILVHNPSFPRSFKAEYELTMLFLSTNFLMKSEQNSRVVLLQLK